MGDVPVFQAHNGVLKFYNFVLVSNILGTDSFEVSGAQWPRIPCPWALHAATLCPLCEDLLLKDHGSTSSPLLVFSYVFLWKLL